MNEKTIISFRVYQANRLEQRAENQYVAGIIIIESPCNSTEESDYKPLSYQGRRQDFQKGGSALSIESPQRESGAVYTCTRVFL